MFPRYIGLSPAVLSSPLFNRGPSTVSINSIPFNLTFNLLNGSLHVLDSAQHYALISKLIPSLPPSSSILQQDPSYKTALYVNCEEDYGGGKLLALYITFMVYPSEEDTRRYSNATLSHTFGSIPLGSAVSDTTLSFQDQHSAPPIYQDLLFIQALQEIVQKSSPHTVLYPAHPDEDTRHVYYDDWSLGALLRHRESVLLNLNTATPPSLTELACIAHTKTPSGIYVEFRDNLHQECVSRLEQSALNQLSC